MAQFLSTPSARRATTPDMSLWTLLSYFYPRPPRGGRPDHQDAVLRRNNFYPRPPRGGRPGETLPNIQASQFLSTPSARRATQHADDRLRGVAISIHALREEGDAPASSLPSTPSNFYPRPPRGGRQYRCAECGCLDNISIHALREEGDDNTTERGRTQKYFYPRPPRGGRRAKLSTR